MTVKNIHGQQAIDSREVAEMVAKQHAHLMRDIARYTEVMKKSANPKLDSLNFFIPSSYIDHQGKERPCYLITKKGCDMIANKLTGEKGVLFTAAYVTAFEEMQTALDMPYQRPAFYPAKATSLGEVASFIKELRITMERARQPPETVLRQVELTCKQFGAATIPDFIRVSPFEQMSLYLPEPPTQAKMPQ